MDNKEKKRIMTDLAKGKISKLEVELLIDQEKTQPEALKQEFEASGNKDHAHKRKKSIKLQEVK